MTLDEALIEIGELEDALAMLAEENQRLKASAFTRLE